MEAPASALDSKWCSSSDMADLLSSERKRLIQREVDLDDQRGRDEKRQRIFGRGIGIYINK